MPTHQSSQTASVKRQKIICLMGPTASGKTHLAVQLVQKFPLEIISVDSAMVYRTMDIGTAKPEPAILKIAPHHLIDIRDPAQSYSAAHFKSDASTLIQEILHRNKIPLLVGGTLLYFQSLVSGLSELPSADPLIRTEIAKQAEQNGWPAMHAQLAKIDASAAKRIHPHDAQRIQRALEIYTLTGKSLSTLLDQHKAVPSAYENINLIVAPALRSVLHERIEKRLDDMLSNGFIDEVRMLYERGDLSLDLPSIRSVGYRQYWQYFLGQYNAEEARDRAIFASRQFAKRQLTWLRSLQGANENAANQNSKQHADQRDNLHPNWFDSEDPALFEKICKLLCI